MKKFTIFLAVCVLFAVGCSNEVTKINNITTDDLRAMKTIVELGGAPDSSAEGIASFLVGYDGVYSTEGGFAGYKIKDSKIYYVSKLNDTNDVWTEITEGIVVDKNLNKLEYQSANGLEILTFDGFGYRSFIQGEERTAYYQKYDYLDGFAGIYFNEQVGIYLEISADGCVTRYNKKDGRWSWGRYTSQVVLVDKILTFKGADGAIFKFDITNVNGKVQGGVTYWEDSSPDSLPWWLAVTDQVVLN